MDQVMDIVKLIKFIFQRKKEFRQQSQILDFENRRQNLK